MKKQAQLRPKAVERGKYSGNDNCNDAQANTNRYRPDADGEAMHKGRERNDQKSSRDDNAERTIGRCFDLYVMRLKTFV
jgi:hypothetical protein